MININAILNDDKHMAEVLSTIAPKNSQPKNFILMSDDGITITADNISISTRNTHLDDEKPLGNVA